MDCKCQARLANSVRAFRQSGIAQQHSCGVLKCRHARPDVELQRCVPQVCDQPALPHAVAADAQIPGMLGLIISKHFCLVLTCCLRHIELRSVRGSEGVKIAWGKSLLQNSIQQAKGRKRGSDESNFFLETTSSGTFFIGFHEDCICNWSMSKLYRHDRQL